MPSSKDFFGMVDRDAGLHCGGDPEILRITLSDARSLISCHSHFLHNTINEIIEVLVTLGGLACSRERRVLFWLHR